MSPPIKLALVVGTNYHGTDVELNGCIADAEDMTECLTDRGYHVTTLLGSEATFGAHRDALRALVHESKPGQRLIHYNSSHGTEVPDTDGDEKNGYDQAIVPDDFLSGAMLVDDDFRSILSWLPFGVGYTSVMDCCFGGSMTRLFNPFPHGAARVPDMPRLRARYIPRQWSVSKSYMDWRAQGWEGPNARVEAHVSPRARSETWVNFSACRDDEVAYEVNGRGIFTKALTGILRSSGATLTVSGALTRVRKAMGGQTPQTATIDAPPSELRRVLFGSRR